MLWVQTANSILFYLNSCRNLRDGNLKTWKSKTETICYDVLYIYTHIHIHTYAWLMWLSPIISNPILKSHRNMTTSYRNWPFEVQSCSSWTLLHHDFDPSIISRVNHIYACNLSSLRSLSLFITSVKNIQIGLDLLGLSCGSLRHDSFTCPSLFPIIPPSVPFSLQSTGWEVTRGQLCSCRFKARAAQNKLGSLGCWSGVITHTHLCRWLSADKGR